MEEKWKWEIKKKSHLSSLQTIKDKLRVWYLPLVWALLWVCALSVVYLFINTGFSLPCWPADSGPEWDSGRSFSILTSCDMFVLETLHWFKIKNEIWKHPVKHGIFYDGMDLKIYSIHTILCCSFSVFLQHTNISYFNKS